MHQCDACGSIESETFHVYSTLKYKLEPLWNTEIVHKWEATLVTSQIIFWESSVPVGGGMGQGNGVLLPAWRRMNELLYTNGRKYKGKSFLCQSWFLLYEQQPLWSSVGDLCGWYSWQLYIYIYIYWLMWCPCGYHSRFYCKSSGTCFTDKSKLNHHWDWGVDKWLHCNLVDPIPPPTKQSILYLLIDCSHHGIAVVLAYWDIAISICITQMVSTYIIHIHYAVFQKIVTHIYKFSYLVA